MSMCPTCNGMLPVHIPCPRCSTPMQDHGKITDFYEPYSPYREIDHIKMSEPFPTAEPPSDSASCLHLISCPHCLIEGTVSIEEMNL